MNEYIKIKKFKNLKDNLTFILSQKNCDLSANYECLEGESPLTLQEPDDLKETMNIISKREVDTKAVQDTYIFN